MLVLTTYTIILLCIKILLFVFSFINIESSSSDNIDNDEYLRDGTDYGNITRIHEESEGDIPSDKVMETMYMDNRLEDVEKDLNATIVSGEDRKPSTSIWEGIMGLLEDIDRDPRSIDVSVPV